MKSKIKDSVKNSLKSALAAAVFKPLGARMHGNLTCLVYHRVLPKSELEKSAAKFSPNLSLSVSAEAFEIQMKYLSENYLCLSLPDAVVLLTENRLPPKVALVTFDDGYRDNLTYALPILKKYGMPATIYITSALIGEVVLPWWYELERLYRHARRLEFEWSGKKYVYDIREDIARESSFLEVTALLKTLPPAEQSELMDLVRAQIPGAPHLPCPFLTWEEVKVLDEEPLITLGVHTDHHFVLSRLSEADLRRELADSRNALEARLGHSVPHLAYPFGGEADASEREFQISRELGFLSAVTTRPGHISARDRFRMFSLPRIFVSYFDDLANFRWKLSGFSAGKWSDIFRGSRT